MTARASQTPRVRRTPDNAPMLDAWAEGRLLIQRCSGCGTEFFYPRAVCPSCRSDDIAWQENGGEGTIVSFSLVHKGLPQVFLPQAPIVLAEIRLDSGATMIARVASSRQTEVAIGDRVGLVDPSCARDFALPTFRRLRER